MPTLKLGPYRIPIKYLKDLTVGDTPVFGCYSDDPQLIELDRSLKDRPDQHFAVLLHEALEAINVIYAMHLTHDQIEQLTSTLAQLLRDNRLPRQLLDSP